MPEDPFAAPAADPFAGPAVAEEPMPPESVAEEPVAPDAAAPDLPVVNAEGEVISAPAEPAPAAEEAPAPPVEATPPAEVAEEAQEAVVAPETVAAAPVATATPPAPAPAPPAATTAATTTDATAPASPPAERTPGPRGGKGEMRHYKLLYMSGPDTWTQMDLSTVPNDIGVVVCKVTPQKELDELAEKKVKLRDATGEVQARLTAEIDSLERLHKELWFEARNNEHANRLGFAIMKNPKDGCHIFPVPRGAWKPKHVKPAPPRPERERVVIY